MPISRFSRYYGLDVLRSNGKVSLMQRPAIESEAMPDSITHVLIGGETVDQLAKRYYGREDLWWRIADANPARHPLDWRAGDRLVIPPIRIATRVARG